ncbi:hypothetical protein [Variovorax sp. GB4P3]|uniref:hypothetical protein n=1 Tax=Variovorax sp. GB4P3 TaxID=3443738 RepID=UPI003F48A536
MHLADAKCDHTVLAPGKDREIVQSLATRAMPGLSRRARAIEETSKYRQLSTVTVVKNSFPSLLLCVQLGCEFPLRSDRGLSCVCN